MVSFDAFKPEGNIPIYLELILFIKRQIIAHEIVNEDPLPSRREVSARLGINPNTVQKAYKQLEDEGLIESRPGAKSCVSVNEKTVRQIKNDLVKEEVRGIVKTMKEMGIEKQEAMEWLDKNWEDEVD